MHNYSFSTNEITWNRDCQLCDEDLRLISEDAKWVILLLLWWPHLQRDGLQLWVERGAPKHKLIVGIPIYGRTYTLGSKDNHGLHAGIRRWDTDGGKPGPYTNASGFHAYFEICKNVQDNGWKREWDDIGKCPYAYKDDQWVGYEDEQSLAIKLDFIIKQGYGGAMVWAVDMDDYRADCHSMKNPLMTMISSVMDSFEPPEIPSTTMTTTTTSRPMDEGSGSSSGSKSTSSTTTTTRRPVLPPDSKVCRDPQFMFYPHEKGKSFTQLSHLTPTTALSRPASAESAQ